MKFFAVLCVLTALGAVALNEQKAAAEPEIAEFVLVVEETAPEKTVSPPQEREIEIALRTGTGVQTIPMEEYLVGVLLSELPVSFSDEAFMAQAVAARTFTAGNLKNGKHETGTVCADAGCCQAWRSEEELRRVFGDAYAKSAEKARRAIEKTAGEVLSYGGELIEAVYYSCSGGATEPAVAVWGTDVPYLQSVKSPGEESAAKYQTEVRVPFQRFCEVLRGADANVTFPVIPEDWIGTVTRSDGGGVLTAELGGVKFSGTKLRSLFSLASTLFDLRVADGEVVFSVKGYGHRVGMSQYGADAMARQGCSYEEILQHYYTGVTIKKLSRSESGQLYLQNRD